MIELLAPAGDLEKLKIALLYGADAVFIGGVDFSLRARASNFTIADIQEATTFAHQLNKKVYVTTNIIPHHEDMADLIPYLVALEKASVDAIISASPYIVDTALKNTTLEIHLSTQQSAMNANTVNYWYEKGVKRIVLGRELSVPEIDEITSKTKTDIEVFIHGGMCMSFSGRCSLSNNMTKRDANRGGCAHSCRWNYEIVDEEHRIISDSATPFSMSSKDLNAINQITRLIDANVASLKIEGRMKSLHYIATVVSVYRMLIDEYLSSGKVKDYQFYDAELFKAENRITSHGYLLGLPNYEGQLYNQRSERPNQIFVGIVRSFDRATNVAVIEQRNYFEVGEKLETFSPNHERKTFDLTEMFDQKTNELLTVARHPHQMILIKLPYEVLPNTFLRRAVNEGI